MPSHYWNQAFISLQVQMEAEKQIFLMPFIIYA